MDGQFGTTSRWRRTAAFAIFVLATLGGCASVPPVTGRGELLSVETAAPDQIRWPAQYRPERATFYVHNEIEIAAPPEVVWDILVRAGAWSDWYEGASGVRVKDSPTGTLQPNSVFDWRTMGRDFTSVVREFAPPYRLAWESRREDIQGYHAWLLIPTAGGTRLVTDESQFGLLAVLQKLFIPNKLRRLHDSWLCGIKQQAEATVSKTRRDLPPSVRIEE